MSPEEFARMSQAAETHWWYRGLRDAILRAVKRYLIPGPAPVHVLDAGCGTGENLRALQQTIQPAYAGGFDLSPLALQYAAEKCPGADLYLSDLCTPTLHQPALDLVLSCDVLSVPGITQALPGLQTLVAALRPGGLLVLNLPAYAWLHSRHDAAVAQSHRFCAREVRTLIDTLQLQLELLTYRVWTLFPAIVLYRLPSLLRKRSTADGPSDVSAAPSWWNAAASMLLRGENRAVDAGVRFPWGSSVFAVARKPVGR